MDRYWLLTSTFYGNWLPGDSRGFVSRVRDERPDDPAVTHRVEHDLPGTPYDSGLGGLRRSAESRMKGRAVTLTATQADLLGGQFVETALYRGWDLAAASIMANHVHLVVGVPGDPDPVQLLRDFKSYGSRALNVQYGKPAGGTWWTEKGSTRKLPDAAAVTAATNYVLRQHGALWTHPKPGERPV